MVTSAERRRDEKMARVAGVQTGAGEPVGVAQRDALLDVALEGVVQAAARRR